MLTPANWSFPAEEGGEFAAHEPVLAGGVDVEVLEPAKELEPAEELATVEADAGRHWE